MANSINWGEIYNSTWWGDEDYTANSLFNDAAPSGFGFEGFLETYTGAVVAYSTNRLSSLYSSTLFRTRRSSDNTEDDIGFGDDNLLNTTALETFVGNKNLFEHSDPIAAGTRVMSGTITSSANDWGLGFNNKLIFAATIPSTEVVYDADLEASTEYTFAVRVKFPNGETIDATKFGSGSGKYFYFIAGSGAISSGYSVTELDTNIYLVQVTSTTGSASNSVGVVRTTANEGASMEMTGFQINEGDTLLSYTATDGEVSGDGAVSIYEDQVDSTYNKETSDFSVGTNSYSSVSANDSLTRLDSFEGVDNVLKLEATTGATSVHQMRKNIGQGDHFRYLVSCKIYIPTSNTGITKVALYNGSDLYRVIDKATEGNQWVTLENEEYFGSANSRFFVVGLNDAEDLSFASTTGDKFYLADVVIDGNYDLSNGTSDEQPLIVDGGTTETDNFIDFDGSNDRLVTKAIDAFQGDFTLDLEVEFTDVTTRQAIFTNTTTSSDRFGITIISGRLHFDYFDGSVYTGGRVTSLSTGTYKITLTRESGVFTIYFNGVSQTIGSVGGYLGSIQTNQMLIGDYRNVTNPTNPFLGRVRTCIVYDSAQPEAHATAFNSLFS